MATPLLITADEQTFVDLIKTETRKLTTDGVMVDTNGDGAGDTPYAPTAVPVKDFDQYVKPGSEKDDSCMDGLRSAHVVMVRRIRPFGWHGEVLAPSLAFSGATDIVTVSIAAANRLHVDRQMLAVVNFSAFASNANARLDFWVDIDGVETTRMKFLFNEASSHRAMGGNWLVTLPAGAASIKLRAIRGAGTGNLNLDSSDSATLTLWG